MTEQEALLKFIHTTLLRDEGVEVGVETLLFENRLLDSMNILQLIGYVESRLGRRIDEDEIVMANFRSPEAIVDQFFGGDDGN